MFRMNKIISTVSSLFSTKWLSRILLLTAVMLFVSCKPEVVFDTELLVGKWVSGTEYYRFDNGGKGATWDTSDDVQESEAQPFTWEFDGETHDLTLVHQMEMGGQIPKSYEVTDLTESVLKFKDRYGQTYSYNRVK